MPTELKMPALSPTMEEGTLAKWLVKEGDDVRSGDILAEIETDKATMEFEAVDEGKIAKILVPEGTDGVKVGQPIALLAGDGEQVSDAAPAAAPAPTAAPEPDRTQDSEGVEIPASQQDEATPTPHVFETAARDRLADVREFDLFVRDRLLHRAGHDEVASERRSGSRRRCAGRSWSRSGGPPCRGVDVGPDDAAAGAAPLDGRKVDVLRLGEAAGQRGGFDPLSLSL